MDSRSPDQSCVHQLAHRPAAILPPRGPLTRMTRNFIRSYMPRTIGPIPTRKLAATHFQVELMHASVIWKDWRLPFPRGRAKSKFLSVLQYFYMRSAWARLYWGMKIQLLLAISVVGSALVGGAEPLVVHEWGTFTSLQDEAGMTIGGINTDDEPGPPFCHDLDTSLILGPDETPRVFYKGVRGCHPDVTMRLETPVL